MIAIVKYEQKCLPLNHMKGKKILFQKTIDKMEVKHCTVFAYTKQQSVLFPYINNIIYLLKNKITN